MQITKKVEILFIAITFELNKRNLKIIKEPK